LPLLRKHSPERNKAHPITAH